MNEIIGYCCKNELELDLPYNKSITIYPSPYQALQKECICKGDCTMVAVKIEIDRVVKEGT